MGSVEAGSDGARRRRWILHVDMDQFVAAVEVRRRPELRGRPVVVGGRGDPTERRTVVATASYEARAYGVHSGMPLRQAARLCPDAVFLPTDHAAYDEASAEVMATLRTFDVDVEVWGWDEAYVAVDLDESTDPEVLARAMQGAVLAATQLACSIGIGDTTLRAKTATGFAKPAGVSRLTRTDWLPVMGQRPTEELWGIGRATAARLAELGITTVAELAASDPVVLAERFGPTTGPRLRLVGRGAGATSVSTEPWVARSRSRETTYPRDLTERAEIEGQVVALAREVAGEVLGEGRVVVRVSVKLRTASFFTRTRITKLPAPSTDVAEIERAALMVLDRFEPGRAVRLLGVRLELAPP